MKDFKKMVKMADGGSTNEEVSQTSRYVKPAKPDLSGGARGFFSELKETMSKPTTTKSGGSGASSSGGTASDMKQLVNPRAMKSGGKAKKKK